MAQKDIYTLGFLAGGYKAIAQFKGIDLAQFPAPPEKSSSLSSLLVGWDAADWQVITPLLTSGKMPHLTALMEGGVQAQLATIDPPISRFGVLLLQRNGLPSMAFTDLQRL